MPENADLISTSGVTNQVPVSISYGPWPVWGQPVLAYANVNPMPTDRNDVTYSAWIRISRSAQGYGQLKDPTDPNSYKDGDSYIELPEGYDYAVRVNPDGDSVFVHAKPNGDKRLAYLKIEPYRASTIDDALNAARTAVNSTSYSFRYRPNYHCSGMRFLFGAMTKHKSEWSTKASSFGALFAA